MSGLHGVETIELTTGTVAVQTISTAVIGLVGTRTFQRRSLTRWQVNNR
ncbi:hypothetical protein WKQ56_004026 [Escherichia coli]|nr:hypothetical protein [Escherichia coli]EKR9809218.1 hypothetical protein [Escherichia coli]